MAEVNSGIGERTVRKRVSCVAIRQPIGLQVELEQVVSGLRRNSASGETTISGAFIGTPASVLFGRGNSLDRRRRTFLAGDVGGEEG